MSDWAGLYHLVAKRFELEDVTAIDELRRRIEEEIMDNSRTWRNFWSMFWQISLHLLAFIWPFVVFILMVLHTVLEGNVISLVYPVLIFCWGLLTVPRPSIRFWKCVTLFTLFVMIVKHICRLSFLPWNTEGPLATWNPYDPPRFIGIERSSTYGALHLVILIFLLIQCYFLRRYGMWPQEQQQQQRRTGDEVRDQGQQADESDGIHRFAPDLYGWAFLCDITILIILLVDFNSFTSSDVLEAGGVTTYFIYDKVPWSFVILLFGWFCDLIVERTLYIIRKRKGKIGFHFIIIFVVHVVVFGFLPHYHQRSFYQNHTAQVWYAVRCISFALSAHQIKYGYPDNVHGHACAKNYSFFHAWVFKGYLAIPFLMEIRTLLGWACTTTCLSRRQWFQCEDIYARVYIAKYDKIKDKKEDSTKSLKEWAEAFLLFVGLLLPICLPLVLFSIYTEEANTNPPTLAILTISIGGYEPIFRSTATFGRSIHSLTPKDLEDLANLYPSHGEAAQFIMGHHPEDVSRIDFDGLSLSDWDITPDSLQELKNDLSGDLPYPFWLDFEVKFKRKPDGKHYDELWGRFNVELSPRKYAGVRHSLLDAISNGSSDTPIEISDVFPRYLHLGRYAEVQPVNLLSQGAEKCGINLWQYSDDKIYAKWWLLGEIHASCHNDNKVGHNSPPKVRIITFNDRINTDSTLSVMSKFGLLSLYAGVVLALHRLIRGSITEDHRTLMFRQLEDFEPLIRLFSALHRMIELKHLPAQRRLYEFLISLYADPARLREFTSSRQQDPQAAATVSQLALVRLKSEKDKVRCQPEKVIYLHTGSIALWVSVSEGDLPSCWPNTSADAETEIPHA